MFFAAWIEAKDLALAIAPGDAVGRAVRPQAQAGQPAAAISAPMGWKRNFASAVRGSSRHKPPPPPLTYRQPVSRLKMPSGLTYP